ncbi:hypothetical protein C8A01DRAFT_37526 [Parachaetomium inaequale]|uniref:Uncharacterized protein n=1 Tax=Parachaetomium inaequale TaxID=2588326 RepID=A0AAN6PCV0_9PEZI|nr:hypothetical protein C8A01DRAFT_37526 [Parachaetomium inaequale]
MLPRVGSMFRRRRRGGSKPGPSPPLTTGETDNPSPPRAIHTSDPRPSSFKLRPVDSQSIFVSVVNAKGGTNYQRLYWLLGREKEQGYEFDGYDEYDTRYLCDGYDYEVNFHPPSASYGTAYLCFMQHVCLVFTYDASSRESWDETVAAYERMRSQCEDGVLPFVGTMIAAMGEGPVSYEEAEAFANQRGSLFVKFSPVTGQGLGNAVGSLVEQAHAVRDQQTADTDGLRSEEPGSTASRKLLKRAEAIQALFAEYTS